jgi:thiamine-phosphate pyrophosphorylase
MQLAGSGVDGIAVVSAIFGAEDVRKATEGSCMFYLRRWSVDETAGAIFDLDGTLLDSMFIWDTLGGGLPGVPWQNAEPGLKERLRPMSLDQVARMFIENTVWGCA